MLPLMRRTLTITLDVDWIYRRLAPIIVRRCTNIALELNARIRQTVLQAYREVAELTRSWYGEDSRLGGVQTVGSTIAIALFLFAIILLWDLFTA